MSEYEKRDRPGGGAPLPLERAERRERHLWICSVVVMLALTAAVLVAHIPGLMASASAPAISLKTTLLGLALLSILYCGYVLEAVGSIRALRHRLGMAEDESTRTRALLDGERWMARALIASEGNTRSLMNANADGIVVIDERGDVKYLNPSAAALFGSEAERMLGSSQALVKAAEEGGEIVIARADGRRTIAEVRIIRTTWDGRDATLATVRDISTRKESETALREANAKLKRMDQAKSDFVSMVSHELRTPLTSIRNAVHIMLSGKAGPHTDTHQRFLQMALRNIDRLAGIVNEILSVAKLESGKMEFAFSDTDLRPTVEHVVQTFSPEADATSLGLRAALPEGLPAVHADVGRVEQVLCNLVSNALKFTPAGGTVTIGAERRDDVVVVEVSDTGIGIAPEDQERIFEPFFQAGDLMTRSSKGTGLGMTIAREIVEGHGGRLWVESAPGRGSCFRFTLPVSSPRTVEMTAFERCFRRNRDRECISVLIVEVCGAEDGRPSVGLPGVLLPILEQVKTRIEERLRKATDSVIMQAECSRLLVMLPETPRSGAAELRKNLLRMLNTSPPAGTDGRPCPIVISGPATYPEDGVTGRDLIDSVLDGEACRRRAHG